MTEFLTAVSVVVIIWFIWTRSRKKRAEVIDRRTAGVALTNGTQRRPDRLVELQAPVEAWLPIVGTSHHSAIEYALDGPVEVRLKREPENAYDPNAIGAWIGNRKLGYVPRRMAARYAPAIDHAGGTIRVPGYCSGGSIDITPVGLPPAAPVQAWRPITAWGWTYSSCEVDGEFMSREGIAATFAAAGLPLTDAGAEIDSVPAALIQAADGSGFIDVVIGGHVVGYLPENETKSYHQVIQDLAAQGVVLQVSARIWARQGAKLRGRVTLQLPKAEEIHPPAALPHEPHVVLPPTSSMQVTGEEAYQDALTPFLASGSSASVVATLHCAQIQKARSVADVVEVRVHGRTAGYLSAVSSANTIDLIRACERAGRIPVAHGSLIGNSLKVEMTLRTAKTADVSEEWLSDALRGDPVN